MNSDKNVTGRDPSPDQLAEAKRLADLYSNTPQNHPSAISSDKTKLQHINTYGFLPEFYIDKVFVCRDCGKEEIWLAKDQKWYYEDSKGHIDATSVRCHACRKQRQKK